MWGRFGSNHSHNAPHILGKETNKVEIPFHPPSMWGCFGSNPSHNAPHTQEGYDMKI